MAVYAVFADGSMVMGASYHDLEMELRSDEWNPSSKAKFRSQLALRARNWSGKVLQEEATSKRFLRGLERAGILRLEESDEDD